LFGWCRYLRHWRVRAIPRSSNNEGPRTVKCISRCGATSASFRTRWCSSFLSAIGHSCRCCHHRADHDLVCRSAADSHSGTKPGTPPAHSRFLQGTTPRSLSGHCRSPQTRPAKVGRDGDRTRCSGRRDCCSWSGDAARLDHAHRSCCCVWQDKVALFQRLSAPPLTSKHLCPVPLEQLEVWPVRSRLRHHDLTPREAPLLAPVVEIIEEVAAHLEAMVTGS
jgi:hypothetical protein